MTLAIKAEGMKELLAALANVSENLPKDVYSALGAAGTKVRSKVAKEVVKEINVKQKTVRSKLSISKNRRNLTVTVALKKSARIPLKEFGAKQNKKGVTAKINKGKGAKKLYQPGFTISKFGGHAFTRPGNGRKIAKLKGPSPYGVMKKNTVRRANVLVDATAEIRKQMERRIRFIELKKANKLNWQG